MPFTKLSRLLLVDEETESKVPDIKNLEYKVAESVAPQALAESVENEILYQRKQSNDDYQFVGETNKRRRTDDVMMASPDSSIAMDLELTDVNICTHFCKNLSTKQFMIIKYFLNIFKRLKLT